jgi:hypothetical protein
VTVAPRQNGVVLRQGKYAARFAGLVQVDFNGNAALAKSNRVASVDAGYACVLEVNVSSVHATERTRFENATQCARAGIVQTNCYLV